MASKFSFGKMSVDLAPGHAARVAPEPESPFCLGVLGDFSGGANRGVLEPLGLRRPWQIDCDNFDQVMARMEVTLRLPDPKKSGATISLRFKKPEDFHPDQIIQQIEPLATLLQCRKRLLNPAMSAAAAVELEGLLRGATVAAASVPENPGPAESNDAALARLLEKPSASPPAAKPPPTGIDIQGLIRNIVGAGAAPAPSPHQAPLLSAVDAEMTAQLRFVLSHPAFQQLEAAWRGVELLVRSFGAEETIQLFLINVSKEELAADLQAREELLQSETLRLLRSQSGDHPWGALIGVWTFDDSLEDIGMLGRLAKVAGVLGAPFIGAASPRLVGCASFGDQPDPDDWNRQRSGEGKEAWQALRELPEAAFLGLALPRFLLRQPYGKESDPIDSFSFEELPSASSHEAYLWGNAAIVCGHLLAEAFQADGWEMRPSGYGELGDLPVHRFKQDGEIRVTPCAEAWLSERAGEAILETGIMPVLSVKNRDAVRLVNLQSLRTPSAPLAGQWSQASRLT